MFWKKKAEPQVAERHVPADLAPEASETGGVVKRANDLAEALWALSSLRWRQEPSQKMRNL